MKILNHCWRLKGASWFHEPVKPAQYGILDYFDIITNPMDLGTVKRKLTHNVYRKPEEFQADISLIWENCYKYNGEIHDISKCAKEVESCYLEGKSQHGLTKYMSSVE